MVERNDSGGGNGKTAIKRNLSASNSINMSFRSHESELPLTSSMAC
jgi:hypothetical protein